MQDHSLVAKLDQWFRKGEGLFEISHTVCRIHLPVVKGAEGRNRQGWTYKRSQTGAEASHENQSCSSSQQRALVALSGMSTDLSCPS